jgi:hypothetical protein
VPVALLARIRLSAAGDVLTYRGPFRTRVWRRDEIDCFGIVQSSVSANVGQIQMRTVSGQWAVLRIASAKRRHAPRLQRWLDALEGWHAPIDRLDLS